MMIVVTFNARVFVASVIKCAGGSLNLLLAAHINDLRSYLPGTVRRDDQQMWTNSVISISTAITVVAKNLKIWWKLVLSQPPVKHPSAFSDFPSMFRAVRFDVVNRQK